MVGASHGPCFPEDQHILKVHRVVPEDQLEVVADAEAQHHRAVQQEGKPRPPCDAVQQKQQQHRRQYVHGHQKQIVEIAQEHAPGVVAVGEDQRQRSQADPSGQQHQEPPEKVSDLLPHGPRHIRLTLQEKDLVQPLLQKITSSNSEKIKRGSGSKSAPSYYRRFFSSGQ